mmetsp:Transcript_21448/g.60920  ORF Transcript_21448/g.60920 Transcript_21448/m.60920 type:complete len:335 (-) Transcript_21448:49-1053(-)
MYNRRASWTHCDTELFVCYTLKIMSPQRKHHGPSRHRAALLLDRLQPRLHVCQIGVGLDFLVGVAELRLELGLVLVDLLPQRVRRLLHVGAQGLLLLLLLLVGLLRAPRALLLLELVHASDPRHDLRVLVLLAAAHPLLLQLGLARHDVALDLVQLLLLRLAQPRALRLLRRPRGLLRVGVQPLGRRLGGRRLRGRLLRPRGRHGEEAAHGLQALRHLAGVDVLLVDLELRQLLALRGALLLVVLAGQRVDDLLHLCQQGLVRCLEGLRGRLVHLHLGLVLEERHARLGLLHRLGHAPRSVLGRHGHGSVCLPCLGRSCREVPWAGAGTCGLES